MAAHRRCHPGGRVEERTTTTTVPGTDKYRGGRTEEREQVTLHVRYRYRVDGTDYEADGIEAGDLGLQPAYTAKRLGKAYAPGQRVTVAYDPRDPATGYLRPGPSTPALTMAGLGAAFLLLAWRRRHSQAAGDPVGFVP